MRDFPPVVTAFTGDPALDPDTRTPARLLRWLIREQGSLFWACVAMSLVWSLPPALSPWVFGRAVDEGILPGDPGRIALWTGVLLGITLVGALSGMLYHTVVVRAWLVALYGTTTMVTRTSTDLGHVLPRRTPTGEVLSVAGSDGDQFGSFMEALTSAIGNLVAYLVVAVIVLQVSVPLGLIVLLVAPLLVATSAPLLRPLGRAQTRERSRDSELTSLATDIVAGLRILRGIGGEGIFGDNYARQSQRVRSAGVRAGAWGAVVEAVGVLLSGLFVIALMYLGVQEVRAGDLTVGELVTFLGYALFLLQPIRVFFFSAQKVTRALVSARKASGVLGQRAPWPRESGRETPGADLPEGGDLVDAASGLEVPAGSLTMVVCAVPDESAALADRLGRYLPGGETPPEHDDDLTGRAARRSRTEVESARAALVARDESLAAGEWGVTLGGIDLAAAPMDAVRRTVLVSDTGAHLFAGTLQRAIDPHGRLTRERAEQVLHAAAAEDVYDAMPGGWQGVLDERGRGLSGGQRQRVVLARALAADAPVLVLVEPTSAVDAHTEARIAERLGSARAGRTTVVMTASPLLLHHADRVALLEGGRITDVGTHDDLVARNDRYRHTVLRGEES